MRLMLGILFGVGATLLLFLGYRKVINPYYILTVPKFVNDTSKKVFSLEQINDLKSQSLGLEEKISSLNKRIDDVLIFSGIIVTLLLAINVGVYVNAEKEVGKHMREHFQEHKDKILKISSETEQIFSAMKTELDLAQKLRAQTQSSLQIPSQ